MLFCFKFGIQLALVRIDAEAPYLYLNSKANFSLQLAHNAKSMDFDMALVHRGGGVSEV